MIIHIKSQHRGCAGNGRVFHNYKYNLGYWRCISIFGIIHVTIRTR